ncbi:Glycosyltransferase [Melia azedarach]|uniref:Glycosyltransferase n=1 Tax=Melia azedarach TaxID=155640 RepID=A0ACC1X4D7_MELAZ|nr:Glycosyltransferase [Melia azedarach]
MTKSAGLIINSFECLEYRAFQAILDGQCAPGESVPPVYCIGPVIGGQKGDWEHQHECMSWLDSQPSGSVLFLSFGSLGVFSTKQLKEIAIGLDRSGVNFLWVVEVLNHDSVGGFVTHCGWNSILEAVYAGVPMLAWPLYAEQKMNKAFIVDEVKVAFPVAQSEDGSVSAAELEEQVTELMNWEKGRAVRDRVIAMKAAASMIDGGSNSSCTRQVDSVD